MKKLLALICGTLLSFIVTICFANPSNQAALFDLSQSNKTLDEINIKLSTQNLKLADLQKAVLEINSLQEDANDCVLRSTEKLEKFNAQESASLNTLPNQTPSEYTLYLTQKREQLAQSASQCRLFSLRAGEYKTALKETIQALSATQLFSHGKPIWTLLHTVNLTQEISLISDISQHLSFDAAFFSRVAPLVATLLLSLLLAYLFQIKLFPSISPNHQKMFGAFNKYVYPLIVTSGLSISLTAYHLMGNKIPSLLHVAYTANVYVILQTAFQILFSYFSHQYQPDKNHRRTLRRFTFFLGACALAVILVLFTQAVFRSADAINLVTRLTALPAFITGFLFFSSLFDLPMITEQPRFIRVISKLAILLYIGTLAIALLLGYLPLFVYLLLNAAFSILALVTICLGSTVLFNMTNNLNNNDGAFFQHFRLTLGLKPHKKMPELMLLKTSVFFTAGALLILMLLTIWFPTTQHIDYTYSLINGFTLANISIYPLRIVIGMLSFVFIILSGRYITTALSKKRQTSEDAEAQVAIASLVRYFTFGLAVLFACLIAGVNMTGLAIIAGALSVGIGLGLQSIVNNFVSGLILLIEKPVKSGDRVIVDGIEGFIKKVRVRSTQISTLAKEDVIIPNSDLINKQVTNYMFRDRAWRVICPVGVAYGSDVPLVMKTLLEVSSTHPCVLQDAPNAPSVYFKGFGDSSLNFELWCIINDVNKKHPVSSDLHTEIDRLFREREIVIAFPQRDLHLKTWAPTETPCTTDKN